jgi:hypothetical protein
MWHCQAQHTLRFVARQCFSAQVARPGRASVTGKVCLRPRQDVSPAAGRRDSLPGSPAAARTLTWRDLGSFPQLYSAHHPLLRVFFCRQAAAVAAAAVVVVAAAAAEPAALALAHYTRQEDESARCVLSIHPSTHGTTHSSGFESQGGALGGGSTAAEVC